MGDVLLLMTERLNIDYISDVLAAIWGLTQKEAC
jgi:hypothetical protein